MSSLVRNSTTNLAPARTLRDLVRTCDPDEPLASDDQRWQDLSPARGDHASEALERLLSRNQPGRFIHAALVSHRGTGKSTELRRLTARLSQTYEAVYVEATLEMDPFQIETEDLLLNLAISVEAAMRDRGTPLPDDLLERVRRWFDDVVKTTKWAQGFNAKAAAGFEVKVSTPFTGGLFGSAKALFKQESEYRTEIKQVLRKYPGTLLQSVNELFDATSKLLGERSLLVVVDNLDRYAPEVIDRLLGAGADRIRQLRCNLILTPPIGLLLQPMSSQLDQIYDCHFMHAVHLREPKTRYDQFDGPGRDLMEAALARRVDLDVLIPEKAARDRLISASGGAMPELLDLVFQSGLVARGEVITEADAEIAVAKQKQRLRDWINVNGWLPTLLRIAQEKQIHEDPKCMQVLFHSLAFKYDGWYDIHPLVAEIPEFERARRGEDRERAGPVRRPFVVGERLQERYGAARAEGAERLVRRRYRTNTAWDQYRNGELPFEALCSVSEQAAAAIVMRFFEEAEKDPGPMSPPIAVGSQAPELSGVHLLVSELELLLLQKLGLLQILMEALGRNGRILLFEDVATPILAGEPFPEPALDADESLRLASDLRQALRLANERMLVETIVRPPVGDLPVLKKLLRASELKQQELEERRAQLQKSLGYLAALFDHPERRLLTADFFVTAVLGTHLELTLALDWSAETFQQFSARFNASHPRAIHVPALVRALAVPEADRLDILVKLAELGFADALDARDILALAQRPDGLDDATLAHALDGASRLAWYTSHPGSAVAGIQLADVYSRTIWAAFSSDTGFSQAHKEALAARLLHRAESIDETNATDILDRTLHFLLGLVISRPMHAFIPDPDDPDAGVSSPESLAGRLWQYLASWVGPAGTRRAAYGRAIRQAWLKLDELTSPAGPKKSQFEPLRLIIHSLPDTSLFAPELLTPMTLSAHWADSPLARDGLAFVARSGEAQRASYAQLLEAGVNLLEKGPRQVRMRADVLSYRFAVPSTDSPVLVHAPVEAILLRMAPEKLPAVAEELAFLQGPHDGRAYRYLDQLRKKTDDPKLRRDYARMTVVAPWRLVREEPQSLRTWRSRHDADTTFPNSLEDLQEMLSEPLLEERPESDPMLHMLDARLAAEGFWADRTDAADLFTLACEVPGALASRATLLRFNGELAPREDEIALALHRLRNPNDFSTGQICSDLFFLRYAATHQPLIKLRVRTETPARIEQATVDSSTAQRETSIRDVDLREELPGLFADTLRATMDSPIDTLSYLEPGLLRLCGEVVGRLSPAGYVRPRQGIWLTHRLFRWLWAQLEALSSDRRAAGLAALKKVAPAPQFIPGDDLLHPRRLDRDRYDYRLASVLLALAYMDTLAVRRERDAAHAEDAAKPGALRSVSSPAIEGMLLELAARPLTDEERELRQLGTEPSCLDWHGPAAVPDLALMALLRLNIGRYIDLPADVRMRWLRDLPRGGAAKHTVIEELAGLIIVACSRHAAKLSEPEQSALEEYTRSPNGLNPERARLARWSVLVPLFVGGRRHLEEEVRSLILSGLNVPMAPAAFSGYVAAFSFYAPERIEAEAKRILDAVQAEGLDPVPFASKLTGAIFSGHKDGIRRIQSVLLDCAARAPYKDDDRFRQALSSIGLSNRV